MVRTLACAGLVLGAAAGCGDDDAAATTATASSTTTSSGMGGAGAAGGSGGASTTTGPGGSGGALAEHRAFVTSQTYDGALGSIEDGDAACQARADAASLGGAWMAWLSTLTVSPSTRFEHATVPYVRVDGAEIAADWEDLVDGTLAAGLDLDETGATVPPMSPVWTGTGPDGLPYGGSCSEWTTVQSGGVWGTAGAVDSTWSFTSGIPCDAMQRLYCFER